ncbi:MAG TPA: TetR/AcrR family transcriptional regulator, partial [Corynebacterium sp.]|nr:TetR/AcrR family transcriptional regulator [Corynebacterium sp.]
DFVRAAQEDGQVRTDLDAGLAGRLTLGTINSITEWYRADGELGPEELSRAVASLIMEGLVKRS